MKIPFVDDVVGALTGSESTGSETQTQEPMAATPSQQALYDDFMVQIFGVDEYIRSIDAEIEELGKGYSSDYFSDLRKNYGIREEQQSLREKQEYFKTKYAGDAGKSLKDRMTEDAALKKSADIVMGQDVSSNIATYLNKLSDSYGAMNASNTEYGGKITGIGANYLDRLKGDVGAWNANTMPLMDSLRPTANSAPVRLKLGDFETPWYTGSQRAAQNKFSGLNTEKLGVDTSLTNTIKDTDSSVAMMLNTIANQNQANNQALSSETVNQNNSVANLLNDIKTSNLPNQPFIDYLNILGNQVNKNENRRYSLPTTNTDTTVKSNKSFLDAMTQITKLLPGANPGA